MKLCIRNDLSVTLEDKGNCFKLVNVEVQGDRMVWTEENSEFLIHILSRSLLGDKHD
ncbi:hypothetical protein [Sulfuracidifex metallicus]|uniref:hypothetical protein n=1 Tax=Sulfuracidifex metallicus TaxID=47303 RepID=UPI000B1D0AFD|nr:hypothetical protein [Sulfuracidifex metallicus]WOE51881.1 hypothetical protein RQ359_001224 [Sulfuracidifex metallicus DSM 6482 = JCM 9184]